MSSEYKFPDNYTKKIELKSEPVYYEEELEDCYLPKYDYEIKKNVWYEYVPIAPFSDRTDIEMRFSPIQVKVLRRKYSKSKIKDLCDRWFKTFEHPEYGKMTYHEFLNKRLGEIIDIIEPEHEKIDKNFSSEEKQEKYREIWLEYAKDLFKDTMKDIKDFGLDDYRIKGPESFGNFFTEISDLRFALLKESYLIGALLQDIDFSGSDLTKSNLSFVVCNECDFTGIDCEEANFSQADIRQINCIGANFKDTNFLNANCNDTDFSRAICSDAIFTGSRCNEAKFIGAHCEDANYLNANCNETNFSRAICSDAIFTGSRCNKANFSGANCDNVTFGCIETIEDGKIIRQCTDLSDAKFDEKSSFLRVNINDVDCSKNMALKMFIEKQQMFDSLKESLPEKLRWFSDVMYFLSTPVNWLAMCFTIIVFFLDVFGFLQTVWPKNAFKMIGTETPHIEMLYFSVVTFSTLGFGDITATHPVSMIAVIAEVFLGYIMLGGLVTFLANWLGRK